MKDLAGSEVYVGYGVIPSYQPARKSGVLEARRRRRQSCPPSQPTVRANSECPILTKFSVVPLQPPRSLPRLHIPEPYDAQAGGGKLIPVHDEGDILVLIVGRC